MNHDYIQYTLNMKITDIEKLKIISKYFMFSINIKYITL